MLILLLLVAAVAGGITYLVMSRWNGLVPATIVCVFGVVFVLGFVAVITAYERDIHRDIREFRPLFMALEGGVPLGLIAGIRSARRKRRESSSQ